MDNLTESDKNWIRHYVDARLRPVRRNIRLLSNDHSFKKDKIQIGDVIEIYCPMYSSEKIKAVVADIDDDCYIMEGGIGRINHEWCTKIK